MPVAIGNAVNCPRLTIIQLGIIETREVYSRANLDAKAPGKHGCLQLACRDLGAHAQQIIVFCSQFSGFLDHKSSYH